MRIKVAKGPYEYLWSYVCGGAIISVATTPSCSLIAAASVDCKLYLLNRDGVLLWDKPLDNEAWAVSISADGSRIAVGTANKKPADGTVYVYNREGREIWRYKIGSPVWGVNLSGDGTILAVASWGNKAYRFIEKAGTYYLEYKKNIGTKGLYGVSLSADGVYCVISSYDDALVLLDNSFSIIKKFPIDTGLYGAKLSPDASIAIAGCRDGRFLLFPSFLNGIPQLSPQMSSRPICGVSISDDGKILALGSFDGRVYVTSAKGHCLWSFETDGEVWSTVLSADGSLVCVGSGDQNIYLLQNLCSSAVLKEIEAVEAAVEKAGNLQLRTRLNDITSLYLRYGLISYGSLRLRELIASDLKLAEEIVQEFLVADIQENPTHYETHYCLANFLKGKKDWISAVRHYQEAANDPIFRSRALNDAGECFSKLGWKTATLSCFHRTREQYLSRDEKKVIYNLARSYEDSGYRREAIKHYQLLLSWDISYRNALERLQKLSLPKAPAPVENRRTDYTGLTVSLLGPDIPRVNEVDGTLVPILEARAKELFVVPGERAKMQNAIDTLIESNSLPKNLRNRGLDYDIISYLKYDYLLPEDEIKKQLEMVNFLSILQDNQWIKSALDIGAATGRYPTILASMGIKAIGIDMESDAMAYAQRKKTASSYPYYCICDALHLPFSSKSFDLISCMMGTFAHFSPEKRENICREFWRVLRPEGLLIISTWDIECKHLSFLSMYSQSQKEMIRRNSFTRADIQEFLEQLGLQVLGIKSFALLPDLFSYELKFEELTATDIRRIVEFDFATHGIFPNFHGQMFMVYAKKSI